MIAAALMAFLHHVFAFTLVACLVYEFAAFRKGMSIAELKRLQRVDLTYGVSAGLLLVVGLLRIFVFEKGIKFYASNPYFWGKMIAFLLVGLMSINPTVQFVRWNKSLSKNKVPEISDKEYGRTRLLLWLELSGVLVILFAAPMMARGIGIH